MNLGSGTHFTASASPGSRGEKSETTHWSGYGEGRECVAWPFLVAEAVCIPCLWLYHSILTCAAMFLLGSSNSLQKDCFSETGPLINPEESTLIGSRLQSALTVQGTICGHL